MIKKHEISKSYNQLFMYKNKQKHWVHITCDKIITKNIKLYKGAINKVHMKKKSLGTSNLG